MKHFTTIVKKYNQYKTERRRRELINDWAFGVSAQTLKKLAKDSTYHDRFSRPIIYENDDKKLIIDFGEPDNAKEKHPNSHVLEFDLQKEHYTTHTY